MRYLDRKRFNDDRWGCMLAVSDDNHELTERGLSINDDGSVANDQSQYPGDEFKITESD